MDDEERQKTPSGTTYDPVATQMVFISLMVSCDKVPDIITFI